MENQELLKQIAMLKDGFGYQKDMADTYAKVLREIWDKIENIIEAYEFDGDADIMSHQLKQLKNSIPESALRRAE